MKIVIVDGATATSGGLSWSPLTDLAEVVIYPRTTPAELCSRTEDADIVITNKVEFRREMLKNLPKLKYLGVTATGYNIIDIAAAKERGIAVTNVPAYSTNSVAQLTFALVLEYYSKVGAYSAGVTSGEWTSSPDFCVLSRQIYELTGKTIGIIGRGAIGSAVARIADAFGLRVLFGSIPGREAADKVPLRELLPLCDIVSLHCPLTAETSKIVNRDFLSQMRRDAILVNTSRGGLVDEAALAGALHELTIAHALLDVLSCEPPTSDNPLLTAPNVTITPHIAWGTVEARNRLISEVAENLAAFLRGERRNRVD